MLKTRILNVDILTVSILATLGFIVASGLLYAARQNRWFEGRVKYYTEITDGTDLNIGSNVTIAGLRAGEVLDLTLLEDNRIRVTVGIATSLSKNVSKDAKIIIARISLLGEKVLHLYPGNKSKGPMPPGSTIVAEEVMDVISMLNDKSMMLLVNRFDRMLSELELSLRVLRSLSGGDVTDLDDKQAERIGQVHSIIKSLERTMKALAENDKSLGLLIKRSESVIRNLDTDLLQNQLMSNTLNNINKITEPMANNPDDLAQLLNHMNKMSAKLAAEEGISEPLKQTLEEFRITLRSLQHSWLLEEHARREDKNRKVTPPIKEIAH